MKITILMSVWNESKNIDACFRSLTEQTYQDFSLLIVDDGSTDDTVQKIEQYRDRLEIMIVKLEHVWMSSARNTGIALIPDGYICILDADEILDPHYLENFVSFVKEHPDCKFFAWKSIPTLDSHISRYLEVMEHMIYMMAYEKETSSTNTMVWGNMIVEAHACRQVGSWDETLWRTGDTSLSQRAITSWYTLYTTPRCFLYEKRPSSLWKLLTREYVSWYYVQKQWFWTWNHAIRFTSLLIFPWAVYFFLYLFLLIFYNKKVNGTILVAPMIFFLLFIAWDIGYISNLGHHAMSSPMKRKV